MTDTERNRSMGHEPDVREDDDTADYLGTAGTAPSQGPDPVELVRDPDNRAKLLLGMAAITLLNLILLIAVVFGVFGQRHEVITVEDRPCVVVDLDGESTLFCQR